MGTAAIQGDGVQQNAVASDALGLPGASASSRPLTAISIGPCLVRGGAEQWLIYLTRFLDPQRLRLARTIVTRPDLVDPAFVAEVPIPVEVGQEAAVRRAARECDILLCWGLPLDDLLVGHRPALCVFVAHGEGDWTRMLLGRSTQVTDHVIAVSQRVRDRVCGALPTTVNHNGPALRASGNATA
jgi:hypothetical protein